MVDTIPHSHPAAERPGRTLTLLSHLGQINPITVVIGVTATAFLFWVRKGLKPLLRRMGAGPLLADIVTKAGPVAAVVVTTLAVWAFGLEGRGVSRECHELCVSGLAHAGFRYGHALKRSSNMIAN